MPNLILTGRCSSACEYCFTNGALLGDLTLKTLAEIMPFVSTFRSRKLNILGGEPSLNPEFIGILQYLLERKYELLVFTNGDIAPPVLTGLMGLTTARLEFVVNRSLEVLRANTIKFYRSLGYRTKIGVTIFRANQSVQHLIGEIEEFRLRKAIRIGIALPSYPPFENVHPDPEAYPEISNEIFPFLVECIAKGIKPEFDCGFPHCFFTEEQRALLHEHSAEFVSNCGLIPDILPDRTVIPCFPLGNFKTIINGESSWINSRITLEGLIAGAKRNHLFEVCGSCRHLNSRQCSMGCAAFAVHGGDRGSRVQNDSGRLPSLEVSHS